MDDEPPLPRHRRRSLPRESRSNGFKAKPLIIFASLFATALITAGTNRYKNGEDTYQLRRQLTTSSTQSTDSTNVFASRRRSRAFLLENENETCTQECCLQFEPEICGTGDEWVNNIPFAFQIVLMVVLLCFSALFSGLTLGLMGLDKTGLEIVMEGENETLAEAARKIYPVRANGNLLLCTLLLGNVAVNALLSIVSAELFGGTIGFVSSTMLIVIFGEIIPQAACARYALQIGSRAVPLVRVITFLVYPIAFPLAWALNQVLGNELATTYSSAEMRKLLEIHVQEGRVDQETADAMTGALKYKEISVREVMTSLDNTFMLNVDERLSFETIATIFKTGYSRIPVYEVSVNNVIGLLFVKDLIFIDPEDETPVRNFVQIFGRGVHVVWPDDKLGDVLRELKQGRSHMALVRDVNNTDETQDPFYEIKGIITLEDIIEEIIGDEIVDETDAFVENTHSVKVNRMENFDWGRLRLLDAKIVDETLSFEEAKAVTAHLRTNYASSVGLLTDAQLSKLVSETSVTELPTAEQEIGTDLPDDLLYEKGVESDVCTLILSGKVTVLAGVDKFRSDVSSWSVLGSSALKQPTYRPDFSAFVSSGPCRCLRFTRGRFLSALDGSAIERRANPELHVSQLHSRLDGNNFEASASFNEFLEPLASGDEDTLGSNSGRRPKKKNREEKNARRRRLIAAFQKAKSRSMDFSDDSGEEEGRGVGFASPEERGISNVLSGGGTYQPPTRQSTRMAESYRPTQPSSELEHRPNGGPNGEPNGVMFIEPEKGIDSSE